MFWEEIWTISEFLIWIFFFFFFCLVVKFSVHLNKRVFVMSSKQSAMGQKHKWWSNIFKFNDTVNKCERKMSAFFGFTFWWSRHKTMLYSYSSFETSLKVLTECGRVMISKPFIMSNIKCSLAWQSLVSLVHWSCSLFPRVIPFRIYQYTHPLLISPYKQIYCWKQRLFVCFT